MEITDLSELCRLCLESSSILFPFETKIFYTPKSLLQLIKFCLDIDCNGNDGGIAPKNLCQSCLEKLQFVFDFKSKSQESDRYLKQIISHSTIDQAPQHTTIIDDDEPITTPYSSTYPDDEESLLQPLDDDDYDDDYRNGSKVAKNQKQPKKGNRSGEFECQQCLKTFRYIKAYKNHMKLHKSRPKVNYYQRKKLMLAAEKVNSPPKPTATPSTRYKREAQPAYDTISPYQSSAPYDIDLSDHPQQRDSSPDFGALMLSTSQLIRDDDLDEAEKEIPKTSRTGRILKRPAMDNDLYKPNGGQKRNRPSVPLKKPQTVAAPVKVPPKKEEVPLRKPGPLSSKTRSNSVTKKQSEDNEEGFTIEGFSEVDITKMLKKSKNRGNMNVSIVDEESRQSSSTVRSRSRSPSVELIDEIDIFGGRS